MYISPVERIKKIHIWIGKTSKSEEDYESYFDQEEEVSQFATDIGLDSEYDEDFIGIIPLLPEEKYVSFVLKEETPIHPSEITSAENKCKELGIENANAVFYLTDSSVVVNESNRKYNDLYYIGVFDSSL